MERCTEMKGSRNQINKIEKKNGIHRHLHRPKTPRTVSAPAWVAAVAPGMVQLNVTVPPDNGTVPATLGLGTLRSDTENEREIIFQ